MAKFVEMLLTLLAPWWKPTEPEKPSPPKPSVLPYPTTPKVDSVVAEVLRIHNANRSPESPLKLHSLLTQAAQKHADWMAKNRRMSHRGDKFSSPGARINAVGYQWSTYGENVAWGQTTPEQVMRVWLNSAAHRRNIKNTAYHEIGVGCAVSSNGGVYWCVTFGSRAFTSVNQWDETECYPEFE